MPLYGHIAIAAGVTALLLAGCSPDQPEAEQSAGSNLVQASRAEQPTMAQGEASVGNGFAAFTITRAADTHFYADAQVNGAVVRFLVDTGASTVLLSPGDAQRAGIGAGDFSATGIGVGGTISMMPATAARIALGPLTATNVPVMVSKEEVPVSLLGQSYLSRIGTVAIAGDTMTLR